MIELLIATFAVSLIAVLVIMPWILRLCHKYGLYDTPNTRKVHGGEIPRLGGAVFVPASVIGFCVGLAIALNLNSSLYAMKISSILIGLGFMLVFLIGLIDDIFDLSAHLKFIVQAVAVMALPFNHLYIDNLHGAFGIWEMTPWVGYSLTMLIVMLVINAMNTIDGIDGLSSSLAFIALAVYSYFFYCMQNYIFCFIACSQMGAIMAYMKFNIFGKVENGTKTFMGDSGSLVLGFSLSYLGVKLCSPSNFIPPPEEGVLIPASVLFLPTMDLIRVATQRVVRGVHPFSPDKTHIHHLLLARGLSQHGALLTILGMDATIIALNFILWYSGINMTVILLSDIMIYIIPITIIQRKKR